MYYEVTTDTSVSFELRDPDGNVLTSHSGNA